MPITLPPISRRQFVAGSVAAGVALAASRYLKAQDTRPATDHFALISDSHIDANAADVERDVNMTDNLKKVVAAIVALKEKPSAVIHGGDLVHTSGRAIDYTAYLALIKPLRDAGLPIHMLMGNHDNRENFWAAVPPQADSPEPVEQRHVERLQTPLADWYLLDSLDKTNSTPGTLGEKQLAWLAKSLDANPTKPAIVFPHHHPLDQYQRVTRGITDTKELLAILSPRRQVKLLIFGHTHDWGVFDKQADGMHRINMPPTAYVFDKPRPAGWVDCNLTATGGTFQLLALDETHKEHGQKATLTWR